MMAFVRNEIRKDVPNIERKIAPGIRRARRDSAAVITTQRQEADHPLAAPVERPYELLLAQSAWIDRVRHFDPVLLPQRLDPHAAGVVDVASDHPNCPAGGTGHGGRPELGGQMLDQEDDDSIGRSPHWNESICQVESRRHQRASPSNRAVAKRLGSGAGDFYFDSHNLTTWSRPSAATFVRSQR